MNQIVPLNEKRNLVAGARPAAIVPQTMDDVYRLAQAVAVSGMAPAGMETAEKCTIAILQGLEVGLTPMAALQRIAIINNRPTIWGDAAIGLVRASGLCEYVKEWIDGEGDNRIAYCETRRKGEKDPVTRSFSAKQAIEAGLWTKAIWKQYRERMLQMRARAFCLRDVYADVLGGLYIREEMDEHEAPISNATLSPPVPPEPPAPPPAIEHQPITTVVPSTPEVREQMVTSPQAPADIKQRMQTEGAGDIPDFLDRRTKKQPEPEQEPETVDAEIIDPTEILSQAKQAFATARTPEELETLHDEFMTQLDFPPDREALYAEMKTHEKRLEREAP